VWRRAVYRSGQFFRGFRGALSPAEQDAVRARLTEREWLLFAAMQTRDQRHSLDMVRWLQRHTEPSDDLLAATLLHDVGKGRLVVWDRVAFVLLGVSPALRRRVVRREGGRFRNALWRLQEHARLGGELLQAHGTRPRVVSLVARHKDTSSGADEELRWLLAADAAC
jgi:hypothetical protein